MDETQGKGPAIIVSAPSSGCGKTTVTLGLLAALRRRGLVAAPFKVGPDFIDPGHHARACGRVSRNLDGWMCSKAAVLEIFARGCQGADLAVIEGVMGLFDGAAGDSDEGSTAQIAHWLKGRVLLVIDGGAMARSAAALIQGFCRFDPDLGFAGIVFNRVAGSRHEALLRQAVGSVSGLPPVLGCLPRDEEMRLPERHLGLTTAQDTPSAESFYARVGRQVEKYVDLDFLLAGISTREKGRISTLDKVSVPYGGPSPNKGGKKQRVRIAVARDEAFCFYYPENLELLEKAGAELVFFSPLHQDALPAGIEGIYLGGGYPELHADHLAEKTRILRDLKEAAQRGIPIYAECGGFMLLAEEIDGRPMAGVFPSRARMFSRRKALGYRQVTFRCESPLGPAGTQIRGHEFHYSEMEIPDSVPRMYRLGRRGGEGLGGEGYRLYNVVGSYVHLHFASNPDVAMNFVEFCRQRRS
jgi:cobyrinic acid a,c-diamide synthase